MAPKDDVEGCTLKMMRLVHVYCAKNPRCTSDPQVLPIIDYACSSGGGGGGETKAVGSGEFRNKIMIVPNWFGVKQAAINECSEILLSSGNNRIDYDQLDQCRTMHLFMAYAICTKRKMRGCDNIYRLNKSDNDNIW